MKRSYTYLGTVTGMCRQCRNLVPARILEEEGVVYQERMCPSCGNSRIRIADNVEWYINRTRQTVDCKAAHKPGHAVRQGCPHDCGPCSFHANACRLPVFSITNACNMACPICFTYNRKDLPYHMSRGELRDLLNRLLEQAGPFDLLNITGGEPTLHPELLSLLQECRRPEIGRITMNSNGLRLAKDEGLCRALADLGVYVVLSFDTLRPETSVKIHGNDVVGDKLRALENLERFGIGTTLLNVMIRGVNEDEIGHVVALAKSHRVVRSITVQTMTFTGMGGKNFYPRETMPLDAAANAFEKTASADVRAGDFFAHTGAHPLCYSVAYYLKGRDKLHSLTEFFSIEQLRQMLGQGYLLQPDDKTYQMFQSAIDRLWADGDSQGLLPVIRQLLDKLYPKGKHFTKTERQTLAEENMLTIYVHSHMDEDSLDLARLTVCPDQVPDAEGRLIPACSYNLFYRQKDHRFWTE